MTTSISSRRRCDGVRNSCPLSSCRRYSSTLGAGAEFLSKTRLGRPAPAGTSLSPDA